MSEIIHVAGHVITFGAVVRQRCQWCGALIQEYDLTSIAIQEDGRDPDRRGKPVDADDLGWWDGLVAVDGHVRYAVDAPEDQKAPERSCMMLLPAEVGVV